MFPLHYCDNFPPLVQWLTHFSFVPLSLRSSVLELCSLGGALSHITALKLAGAGESHDFLPRPVTCVSLASPFYGTGGCRRAFEVRVTQSKGHGNIQIL